MKVFQARWIRAAFHSVTADIVRGSWAECGLPSRPHGGLVVADDVPMANGGSDLQLDAVQPSAIGDGNDWVEAIVNWALLGDAVPDLVDAAPEQKEMEMVNVGGGLTLPDIGSLGIVSSERKEEDLVEGVNGLVLDIEGDAVQVQGDGVEVESASTSPGISSTLDDDAMSSSSDEESSDDESSSNMPILSGH